MARDGFFTGLDIGTSSIKVLVAEHVNGEMNVIGVSNAKSAGVKDGIIVDIEAASNAIKNAISQAEEKAGISINLVNVGLPANLLQIEATQGMIPVTSDSKEITDADVENGCKKGISSTGKSCGDWFWDSKRTGTIWRICRCCAGDVLCISAWRGNRKSGVT